MPKSLPDSIFVAATIAADTAGVPCSLPAADASAEQLDRYVKCLQTAEKRKYESSCDERRLAFLEKFRKDDPLASEMALFCRVEAAIADCKAYSAPVTESDAREYRKRRYGWPTATAPVGESCTSPAALQSGTATVMDLLMRYLNDDYERRRRSATEPICVNYASVAYEFLAGFMNVDSIPECIAELAEDSVATLVDCETTEHALRLGIDPVNPFYIRIVPGQMELFGRFDRGGGGCCDLTFIGPVPSGDPEDPTPVVDQMNDLLDTLWGINLGVSRTTQVSSLPYSGGQPYVTYNSRVADSAGIATMNAIYRGIVDTASVRMRDSSLTLNGGAFRFRPLQWDHYHPVVDMDAAAYQGWSVSLGAFDGSWVRLVDSTSIYHNLWRTFGPLQLRVDYQGVNYEATGGGRSTGPLKILLGWELVPSPPQDDTAMQALIFRYWHDNVQEEIELPLTGGDDSYRDYLYDTFTTRIGRFVRTDEHTIGFVTRVTGDTTIIPAIRPYRTHRRRLAGPNTDACLTSAGLCEWTPGCDVCIRWDTAVSDTLLKYVDVVQPRSCEQMAIERLRSQLTVAYGKAVQALRERVEKEYRAGCLNLDHPDPVRVSFAEKLYHYTLFYYDAKGRLVRSVSPKGVDIDTGRTAAGATSHSFVSRFTVDSRGRIVTKTVANGGAEKYHYDSRGRLRFVQDAVQRADSVMSFIKYDRYERVIATGQCRVSAANPATQGNTDNASLPSLVNIRDLVEYHYDSTMASTADSLKWQAITTEHPSAKQRNVRGRLSYAISKPDSVLARNNVRTVFSYDVAGNTTSTITDMPEDSSSNSDRMIKRTEYVRNISTGQITRVEYQKGKSSDQFFRKYEYDHNGSLTHAYSSRDAVHWDLDARLDYDLLGQHRRTTIGEDSVAGMDYVHTLQGQIRGINHPSLDTARDPGHDGRSGTPNANVARDAFGMGYRYYAGDFERSTVGGTPRSPFNDTVSTMPPGTTSLYSGLLSGTSSRTQALPATVSSFRLDGQLVGETYAYDVLGRIRGTAYHLRPGSSWQEQDTSTGRAYSSSFVYDQNSAMVSFERTILDATNATVFTDSARIDFDSANSNVVNVLTDAGIAGYDDAKSLTGGNTTTDVKGRTTKGQVSGNDRVMTWTSFDAIKTVSHNGMTSEFLYDAFGNQVRTIIRTATDTTRIYNIDGGAQIYELVAGVPNIREWSIAGGTSRDTAAASFGPKHYRHIGRKRYELTDHLGSVRGVISDVKLPASGGGFVSELVSVAEYDVYGMERPNRSAVINNDPSSRYGFQGMRRAEGITAGDSLRNDYTTPYRLYDARMGTWMTHDPIMNASVSPYEGLGSNPISLTDPWGLEPIDPPGGQPGVASGAGEGPQTFGLPSEVANSIKTPEAGAIGSILSPPKTPITIPSTFASDFGRGLGSAIGGIFDHIANNPNLEGSMRPKRITPAQAKEYAVDMSRYNTGAKIVENAVVRPTFDGLQSIWYVGQGIAEGDGKLAGINLIPALLALSEIKTPKPGIGVLKHELLDAATPSLLTAVDPTDNIAQQTVKVPYRPGASQIPTTITRTSSLISPQRARHILTGDATGGGHLWPGGRGKSPFPTSWSADRILSVVDDIAGNNTIGGVLQKNGRTLKSTTVDGVNIDVVIAPDGTVVTAFPTNTIRNPK